VWQLHNPRQRSDDPLVASNPTGGPAASWFSRTGRVITEMKEVASVSGNTITFTTPLHISYRASLAAQLTRYAGINAHVKNAGVEDLTVIGGSNGAIHFDAAAYSWAKGVEVTVWHGAGVTVNNAFRIEVRDSYIHDAAWAQPGGAGYAISLAKGSADVLFENNIIMAANKVMVARSSGAGSVFGYNYVDNGYINTTESWIEVGLNASHMVGPHHVLFEGNYGFNWDSDLTHGNAIYHTAFRNHLRCIRSPFINPLSGRKIDDATQTRNGPKRCIGSTAYSYWMSFIGNVLGASGQMSGWTYDVTGPKGTATPAIRQPPPRPSGMATSTISPTRSTGTRTLPIMRSRIHSIFPRSQTSSTQAVVTLGRGSIRSATRSSTRCPPRRDMMQALRSCSREWTLRRVKPLASEISGQ
jgi:hypothetical protein